MYGGGRHTIPHKEDKGGGGEDNNDNNTDGMDDAGVGNLPPPRGI